MLNSFISFCLSKRVFISFVLKLLMSSEFLSAFSKSFQSLIEFNLIAMNGPFAMADERVEEYATG